MKILLTLFTIPPHEPIPAWLFVMGAVGLVMLLAFIVLGLTIDNAMRNTFPKHEEVTDKQREWVETIRQAKRKP